MKLVNMSEVRRFTADARLGSDIEERLNAEIKRLLTKAVERAKENGRNTVMGRDL